MTKNQEPKTKHMNIDSFIQPLHQIGQQAEQQKEIIRQKQNLPDAIIQQLKALPIFRLLVPKAYGGQQASILDLIRVVQLLSYYNGSLGWVVSIIGTSGLCSGYLQPNVAQKIFGPADALTAGFAAPVGKATKVEGGILVSGTWSWGSGIQHCTHIAGGAMLKSTEGQRPISILAYFEPKDLVFMDNWQVLGLHGTNSIDYQANQVFIPDGNWLPFPAQQAQVDDPLYRFSFLGALAAGVSAVGLGLAKRAIDEIKQLSQHKVPNSARRTLAERPIVQEKVAILQAQYQSARLFLEQAIHNNWQAAEQGKIPATTKSEIRLAATYATQQACGIVRQAYQMGGGSSVWNGVKLQELLQDVHMVTQHGIVSPNTYEVMGRVVFGQKVNEWLL